MKRRSLLLGTTAAAAIAGVGATLLWRPRDQGGPHDAYFSGLNELLKAEGPGRPVMLIDRDRMEHNLGVLVGSVGPEKTYRVVVKSLPSVPLLREVMTRARTNALMVFHQPFLNLVADALPAADVLMGKPMPVAAVETFYRKLGASRFQPAMQLQWLVDSRERLEQYQALARRLGVSMRINLEIDVGLHRGGLAHAEAFDPVIELIKSDPERLSFAGFMGYEPHLTGLRADLKHPAVQAVLEQYRAFIDRARQAGFDPAKLTLNGAGSHTLRIYEQDRTMNDLSAGSGVVMPTDFDTYQLRDNLPALFIATPILKRYDEMPFDSTMLRAMSLWDPNMRRLYYIYGGYWMAKPVSPPGIQEPMFHSTNQEPVITSGSVDLAVDDYIFLRPTQSEHVMLQFGDLLTFRGNKLLEQWPVFQQTG